MTGPANEKGVERMAALTAQMVDQLPDGMAMVIVLFAAQDGQFRANVASTVPPNVFAPVLRSWLERYDAGDALPGRVQ